MGKEDDRSDNIKIIFSLISLLLMIPPLMKAEESYYRTLFIFLINRVIDMFFKGKSHEKIFFVVWSLLNQWIGVVACAVAFCSISPDFVKIFQSYNKIINIALFVSAISCVLREMVPLIIKSVQEKLIKEKIKNDVSERKGGSL